MGEKEKARRLKRMRRLPPPFLVATWCCLPLLRMSNPYRIGVSLGVLFGLAVQP